MKEKRRAIELAENSLKLAVSHLSELDDDEFNDSKILIELMKENLDLWTKNYDNSSSESSIEDDTII